MFAVSYIIITVLACIHQFYGNTKNVSSVGCKSYYNTSLKKKIYTQVTDEAAFLGGSSEQQRFLNKNLRYPQVQLDSGSLQSHLNIKLIVDTDGSIKNIAINGKVDKDELTPFESEAFNLIRRMPKWAPGKCNGKIVATEITIPMTVCFLEND